MLTLFSMEPVAASPQTETLAPGEVRTLRLEAGASLIVSDGLLWLTFSGDSSDHLLTAGTTFNFPRGALVVMQALRSEARYKRLP
jgi:hypothetical protein